MILRKETNKEHRFRMLEYLLVLVFLLIRPSEGFLVAPSIRHSPKVLLRSISEFAEAVNGETYLETVLDDALNYTESDILVSRKEMVSPFAPPLTYSKFLTMQVLLLLPCFVLFASRPSYVLAFDLKKKQPTCSANSKSEFQLLSDILPTLD